MRIFYVYILLCSDGTYYTGITNNIDRRFAEHESGLHPESYTYKRRPLELKYVEEFLSPDEAISWEKRIKKMVESKKGSSY